MLEVIQTLFQYNFWAMNQIWNSLETFSEEEFQRDLGEGCGSVRDKLAHICGAEDIWIRRIEKEISPTFRNPSEFSNLAILKKEAESVHQKYKTLLNNCSTEDLKKQIEYKNLKGMDFRTALSEILMHVANHGTYHRGQVASLIRRIKGKPPVTDLIEYYRTIK